MTVCGKFTDVFDGASRFLNCLSSKIVLFKLVSSNWPYYSHSIAAAVRKQANAIFVHFLLNLNLWLAGLTGEFWPVKVTSV